MSAKDAESRAILSGLAGGKGDELRNLARLAPYLKPVESSGTAENLLALRLATLGLGGVGGAGTYAFGEATENDIAKTIGKAAMLTGGGLNAAPALVNALLQGRNAGILASPFIRNPSQALLTTSLQELGRGPTIHALLQE